MYICVEERMHADELQAEARSPRAVNHDIYLSHTRMDGLQTSHWRQVTTPHQRSGSVKRDSGDALSLSQNSDYTDTSTDVGQDAYSPSSQALTETLPEAFQGAFNTVEVPSDPTPAEPPVSSDPEHHPKDEPSSVASGAEHFVGGPGLVWVEDQWCEVPIDSASSPTPSGAPVVVPKRTRAAKVGSERMATEHGDEMNQQRLIVGTGEQFGWDDANADGAVDERNPFPNWQDNWQDFCEARRNRLMARNGKRWAVPSNANLRQTGASDRVFFFRYH